jgi:adenosine kinase
MATVGMDAQPYLDRLDALGISRRFVQTVDGSYTAQAFITTDIDDNQITAFHPGAMNHSHRNAVPGDAGIRLAIVAPDGRDGMLQHAQQLADHGIPFVFDPGQGLPMFSGQELLWFVQRAHYVALNDYEAKLLTEKIGLTADELARKVRALITTRGALGSEIHVDGKVLSIPAVAARQLVDPTGCGDAYRAGLLYGLAHQLDWEVTGRLAAVMGALKIEHGGGQNHTADRTAIVERYKAAFGVPPW